MLPELLWKKRPFEIRNLLNPAFCAVLLCQAIEGYQQESKQDMPYPLVFLVLPLVFPQKIRNSLQNIQVDKSFNTWIQDNSLNFLDFNNVVDFLNPYTKEAIIISMQFNFLAIKKGKLLLPKRLCEPTEIWNNQSESMDCYTKSKFVGRWFARIGSTTIIFKSLGIRL